MHFFTKHIIYLTIFRKIDMEIIPGPPITVPKFGPVTSGGYMVQQITPEIYHVGPLFYFRRKTELLFPDRKINGSVYVWFEKNGTTKQHYFEELREYKKIQKRR